MASGIALVAAQFSLCVALILFGWRSVISSPWLWPGLVGGALILAAAVRTMRRRSRLRVTPAPDASAALCESGIYGRIRHPMYSGLLLAFAMLAIAAGAVGWMLWTSLLLVLLAKIHLEERHWLARDPAYADYRARTRRLIPGLW